MDEQRTLQHTRRDCWQICLRRCSCRRFQQGGFTSAHAMSMDTTEGGEAAPVARVPTMDTASMTQEKQIAYAMEMSGQTGDKSVKLKLLKLDE